MGIFGKKKKEEKQEEGLDPKKDLEGGEQKGVSSKVKKIKDLRPENKRKRREPIRAWSKFDRIVLLVLIFLSFGLSFYFTLGARGYKLPEVFRFSFPNINLFSDETIVLTSKKEDASNTNMIIKGFLKETQGLEGEYGFYVINLKSGQSFGIYEEETFQAASLIKLPVMVGMYLEEKDGNLNLDTKYRLKAEDRVKGSGSLYKRPVGYELTYRDLIKLMGKESDNTAYNICRKYLGDKKIQEIIKQLGMENTNFSDNLTSPKDVGLLFLELSEGRVINEKDTDELLGFLTKTIYEDWLSAGIPDDIRVAHKYGRELGVVNDAGIIFSNPKYILVIMSKNVILKEADSVFPILSKLIYQSITENDD